MSADERTLTDIVEEFHRDLERLDRKAIERTLEVYRQAWIAIEASYRELERRISEAKKAGEPVSPAWLFREARYQSLLRQVIEAIGEAGGTLKGEMQGLQSEAVALAGEHAARAVEAQAPGITLAHDVLDRDALTALAAAFQDDSPLAKWLESLGPDAGKLVRAALVRTVATGQGPQQMARALRRAVGMSMTRAMTIARTETIRAYRFAMFRSVDRNRDVLEGWRWVAALSSRTCASCLALHGRVFPVESRLHDHPNGRCAVVPVTKTWRELGIERPAETRPEPPDRDSWFWGLPRDQRIRIVGRTAYEAMRRGRLDWYRFSDVVNTPWGRTVRRRALREILGERQYAEMRTLARQVDEQMRADLRYAAAIDRFDQAAAFLRSLGLDPFSRDSVGWDSDIKFVTGDDVDFYAAYNPRRASILLGPRFDLNDPRSLHLVLHEMLHAYSNKRGRFYDWEGLAYEEATVEGMTRLLRREYARFSRLPIAWDDELREWETKHPYHRLVETLEAMRKLTGLDKETFYRKLLELPAGMRADQIRWWIEQRSRDLAPRTRQRFEREFKRLHGALTIDILVIQQGG